MKKNLHPPGMRAVSFEVMVNGKPLQEWNHQDSSYICGEKGQEYTLRVTNTTGGRLLTVITVDGLSIMDGEPGSINGTGYILDPWETATIPGWRLDNKSVAKFVFGTSEESYAVKQGTDPSNVGVIGFAMFQDKNQNNTFRGLGNYPYVSREWIKSTPDQPIGTWRNAPTDDGKRYCTAPLGFDNYNGYKGDPGEVVTCSAKPSQLGTKFGSETEHNVVVAAFDRESNPMWTGQLLYDSLEGLRLKGVPVDLKRPNPFPADVQVGCTPPADWQRFCS